MKRLRLKKILFIWLQAILCIIVIAGCGNKEVINKETVDRGQESEAAAPSDTGNVEKKNTEIDTNNKQSGQVSSQGEKELENEEVIEGTFQGMADSHSVEVKVGEKITEYQFMDQAVEDALNKLKEGTSFKFTIKTDEETGVTSITSVVE